MENLFNVLFKYTYVFVLKGIQYKFKIFLAMILKC